MAETTGSASDRTAAGLRAAVGLALRRPRGAWTGVVVASTGFGLLDAAGTVLVFDVLSGLLAGGGGAAIGFAGGSPAVTANPSAVLVLAYFTVRSLLFVAVTRYVVHVSSRAASRVGEDLLLRFILAPLETVEPSGDGRLQRMAFSSVGSLSSVIFPGLATLIVDGVVILAVLGVMLAIAPVLTLIAVVLIGGGFTVVQWFIGGRLARTGAVAHDATRAAFESIDTASRQAVDIRIYRLHHVVLDAYREARARLTRSVANRVALSAAPRAALEVIVLVALATIAVAAEWLGNAPAEATATVGMLGYAALRLQPAIQRLADSLASVRFHQSEILELAEFLADGDSVPAQRSDVKRRRSQRHGPIGFRVHGLSHHFRDGPDVLRDIELECRPGTRIAVLGASGSGKSTLLRLLGGLYEPSRGGVVWTDAAGGEVAQPGTGAIVLISGDHVPWRGSVRFNVALGGAMNGPDVDVTTALKAADATEIVDGLPAGDRTLLGPGGAQLSTGQEQRIALARAFAAHPGAVILDEATSGLPVGVERGILRRLADLRATVIVATHRPDTLLSVDRAIIVADGRIVADGTPERVRTSAAFVDLMLERDRTDPATESAGRA